LFLLLPTVGESYAAVDSKAGDPKVVEVALKAFLTPRAPLSGEAVALTAGEPPNRVPPLKKPAVEVAGLPKPPNREELVLVVVVLPPPPSSNDPGLDVAVVDRPPLNGDIIVEDVVAAVPKAVPEPNKLVLAGLEKLPKVPTGLPVGLRPNVGGPVCPEWF
jgi:hypothetical protein